MSNTVVSTEKRDSPLNKSLLLAASGANCHAAVFSGVNLLAIESSSEQPSIALFSCIEKAVAKAGLDLSQINAFIHDCGPGSTMGLRLTAMTIRTWQAIGGSNTEVYQFRSLDAGMLWHQRQTNAPMALGVMFRRNRIAFIEKPGATISLIDTGGWQSNCQHLHLLPGRNVWLGRDKSEGIPIVEPDYPHAFAALIQQPYLLQRVPQPTVLAPDIVTYQKWNVLQ